MNFGGLAAGKGKAPAAAPAASAEATPPPSLEAGPSTLPAAPALPDPEPSLIQKIMADNPYFSAGAGLMGLGVVLTGLRRGVKLASTAARRRMLITLEIPSKDRAYPWFLEWMAAQANAAKQVPAEHRGIRGILSGRMNQLPSHELAVETTYKQHENGASEALFNLVPGPGTHYFRYSGHWFQVKRERDAKLMDLHSGSPWETLTLTGLSSSRALLPGLLAEARELAEQSTEGKTVVYTAWGTEWRPFGKPRRRREMGSVVLGEGIAERTEADLRAFLGRNKWYAERGIPYRRGYLLHGPPGSGKTSFIQALAGAMQYNIAVLNLAERGLTDDKLNHLLGLVPDRSFILLEDIDSAFTRRVQTSEDGFKSSVTFSGLLNALDGVTSSEERIIFMTTNHYDRLDPALIRPGRVDLHELLDDAAGEQAYRLFVKFYAAGGGAEEAAAEKAVEAGDPDPLLRDEKLSVDEIETLGRDVAAAVDAARADGRTVSMASLQGHFIRHGARESVGGVDALCRVRE
ncbi:Complex III assembly protein translocase and chaperone [Vanrija albida]|uniref:Complex III assembly protein translocase and chaperone n=1 Tax=Vanrija albida TaxID=181172 RepID=A0ABR3QG42_9TREE